MNCMIALDTNVLIYACDRSDPAKQARALDLISATKDGILLWQVVCEFVAAARKLAGQGFTPEHAWNRLDELATLFPIVLPAVGTLERARWLHLQQAWSFWDALIVAACLDAGVTRLYSEDLPGRSAPGGIEIVNPFARPEKPA
jgi:predicted nucleic acid-binding protein